MRLLPLFSKPRNDEFYGILKFLRQILEFPVPAVAAVKIKGAALASGVPAAVRR